MTTPLVLIDTSVWISGFRGEPVVTEQLDRVLDQGTVFVHPWTRYELGLGGTSEAQQSALAELPSPTAQPDGTVWNFVLRNGLRRLGIGWVDAAILASAHAAGLALWTLDAPLARCARRIALPVPRLPRRRK